ncbi:hypothetical protein [Halostagnicola kamekurae]|nr:hypothetical protein [Halostagnicola kamekurae]
MTDGLRGTMIGPVGTVTGLLGTASGPLEAAVSRPTVTRGI